MGQAKKIPLVVVCGPTASGKTDLAIDLALKLQGEIISADSMQIYRQLNIGTAKPSIEEQRGVIHHMQDIVEPQDHYSVADYCTAAVTCIKEVFERGKLPILAGGTGLYIDTLLEGTRFGQGERNTDYRKTLCDIIQTEGKEKLYKMLQEIDPKAAEKLHINDTVRVMRALEINKTTGQTVEEYNQKSKRDESPYDACIIGLTYENRQALYDRINARVDAMMQKGLLLETENLKKEGVDHSATSMQAIGYKELMDYLAGNVSLEEAIEQIKQATRRYAKRQLTWFRRNKEIFWIEKDKVQNPLEEALQRIAQTKILENMRR